MRSDASDAMDASLHAHVAELQGRVAARDRAAETALARVFWVVEMLPGLPRELRGDLLAWAIEDQHAGMPAALMGPIQHEARFWAGHSNPLEMEAYLTAICDALPERTLAESARKRLMLALWETLPEDWRRRFVARVTGGAAA